MALCPCRSGRPYDDCCGPYHAGSRRPPTAESLMRARYSAFARQQVDYLLETVDPRNRHRHKARDLRSWSEGSEWLGLEILSSEGGGPDDKTGSVEFVARYRSEGEEVEHHEVAHFRRESGRWYFVDGKIVGREPIVREAPRVGRNDPCPCGSGKKNKKCCGR